MDLHERIAELQQKLHAAEAISESRENRIIDLQQRLDAVDDENVALKDMVALLLEDYETLRQKLDAVTAENAALKKACNIDGGYQDCPNCDYSQYVESPETPATDDYLNSMHAEGVEMFATSQRTKIGKPHQNDAVLAYSARVANEFAARLRNGGHVGEGGV